MIKQNSLGTIKFDEKIILEELVKTFVSYNSSAYLATKSAKIIGTSEKKISLSEVKQNVDLEFNDSELCIGFAIITEFGHSINDIVMNTFDALHNTFVSMFPNHHINLVIKVIGVKSKSVAIRNLEFAKKYEPVR